MARRVREAQTSGRPPKVREAPSSPDPPGAPVPSVEQSRLIFLPPDWLPLALVGGDAVIAAVSVVAGYWIKYSNATQALPIRPYLVAIPVVVFLYLTALAVTG